MSIRINRKEFKKLVVDNRRLSLVHFMAEWSGACQLISSMYDDIENSYTGMVNFFLVDVEKESKIRDDYGVAEIPTILFFRHGRVVDHIKGLVPRNVLISKIENALSAEMN